MTDTMRERIARIIDPLFDHHEPHLPEWEAFGDRQRAAALEKADQILAELQEMGWVCLPAEFQKECKRIEAEQKRIRKEANEARDFIRNGGRPTGKRFKL